MVSVGGTAPEDVNGDGTQKPYTEKCMITDKAAILEELPQILDSISKSFIPQIEDPRHPFCGWIIEEIHICFNVDEEDEGEDEEEDEEDEEDEENEERKNENADN